MYSQIIHLQNGGYGLVRVHYVAQSAPHKTFWEKLVHLNDPYKPKHVVIRIL
jgi:hypothetical protein